MNTIAVSHLRKTYGTQAAVADVSFTVTAGECLALLGPNGAGKTTTVEILEGFRTATSGTIEILGEDPQQAGRRWRNRVGVVLQSQFTASLLTVAEELALAASSYSNPMTVAETLELVGLSAKASAKVGTLSGGQRRRIDVALGVIGRPEVLFLDEPTTGFDPTARLAFLEMLGELRRQGTTIVLTTHYLPEATALADRVLVMNHGEIIAEGTPEALGSPQLRQPVVSWRDPLSGQPQQQRTDRPTELIRQLAPGGEEILDLTVHRPTLEDIYLQLIGGNLA